MKEVNIFFIYAPKCKHCKQMEITLESAVERSKIPCNIKKLLYTNKVAVNIAVNNSIDDLPGIVVGATGGSFCGDDYDEERILKAIEKSWAKQKKKK